MAQVVFVGELANELGIRPRDVSDLFYSRVLDNKRCPIVGGRRIIPRSYVPHVRSALEERGILPEPNDHAA